MGENKLMKRTERLKRLVNKIDKPCWNCDGTGIVNDKYEFDTHCYVCEEVTLSKRDAKWLCDLAAKGIEREGK